MTVLRFTFEEAGSPQLLEDNIAWAILMAEFVHGKERLRLESGYTVSEDGKACVLRTDGEAGETAARIFCGLTGLRVGQDGYKVERVDRRPVVSA